MLYYKYTMYKYCVLVAFHVGAAYSVQSPCVHCVHVPLQYCVQSLVFTVYMFHSNTVYKVQCSLCTCSTPILCSLQTSLTEHIHVCLSAAYISHSISYMRLVIYSMLVLWTDYNCSVSVFYTTQHILCQYLCSVLHHSAYSMSVSMQCSAPLSIFHVSIYAVFWVFMQCSAALSTCHVSICVNVLHSSACSMSASVSVFCTTQHVPCLQCVQWTLPCQKGGLSEWLVIRWIKFETVQSDKHTTKPYQSLCKFSYFGVFMYFEIMMWGS